MNIITKHLQKILNRNVSYEEQLLKKYGNANNLKKYNLKILFIADTHNCLKNNNETLKYIKAQNNYEPMKIAELDAMIPANNYVLSKFYPFVFIPKDTIAERILYHEYDYGKVSQGYQKDRNEFYYNILAGIQSDKYWSSSYHKLTKAYKQFQAKEVENA